MRLRIYQIDSEKDKNRIKFMSYQFAKERGIDPSIYKLVFDGTIDEANTLEDVFLILNTKCVPGFTGHSLSMSDVVEIIQHGDSGQCHFCDRIGFKTIAFDTSKCAPQFKHPMKVIIKEPNKKAEVITIENQLELLQQIVDGYIETVRLSENIVMIINEEGKLKGLEPNIKLRNDIIVGTLVICGIKGPEFASLDDADEIKKYIEYLNAE